MKNKTIRFGINIGTLLMLSIFCSLSVRAELPADIRITIQPLDSAFSGSDDVMLRISYTNVGQEPITFLRWSTALEGRINDDFLEVFIEGEPLQYIGRHYKRGTPTVDDYITLLANESRSADVDLNDGYAVILKGMYSVEYADQNFVNKQKSQVASFRLMEDKPLLSSKQPPNYLSCSSTEQQQIDASLSAAEKLSFTAINDINDTPLDKRSSAKRYQQWFGSYTENRWNTVASHFTKISNATRNTAIAFDCGCNEDYFAYVFSNQPYRIYLCNAFWSAPTIGTDSKAGTIIHELSHFTVLGGTDDHVYGQSGARSLALNNPNQAIDNADSHEYFAENTPALTMPEPEVPIVVPVTPPVVQESPIVIAPIVELLLDD